MWQYWIYYVLLVAILLAGLFLTVVTLPGLWVMLGAVAAYAWLTGWAYVGKWTLAVLLGLALLAELVEFVAAGASAKRAGASRRGLIGATIGGVVGAIFFSISLPIPGVGTILGACLGTCLGAVLAELTGDKQLGQIARIGLGAAKGRLLGTLGKLAFGFVMLLVSLWMAFPMGGTPSAPKAKVPAIAPTTLHAVTSRDFERF